MNGYYERKRKELSDQAQKLAKAMKILTDAIYYGKDSIKNRVKRTIYKYQSYSGDYRKLNTSDLKKLLEKIKYSGYKSATSALRDAKFDYYSMNHITIFEIKIVPVGKLKN